MLYSKSAEYAIQAMIYLAEKDSPDPVMVGEIAKAYGIPRQFLSKIAQVLAKQRLLKAIRGRKGGVKLARPAAEIKINQIVYAVDGVPKDEEICVIGLDTCSDDTPCPFHNQWKPIRRQIRHILEEENLAHLAQRMVEKRQSIRRRGITDQTGQPAS